MDNSELEYKPNEQSIIRNFLKRIDGSMEVSKQPFSTIVKEFRENLLISRAEVARRAGVSPLTINRIENGMSCRIDTKRKIILALERSFSSLSKIIPNNSKSNDMV